MRANEVFHEYKISRILENSQVENSCNCYLLGIVMPPGIRIPGTRPGISGIFDTRTRPKPDSLPDGYPSGIRAVKNLHKMGIKAKKIHQNFLPSYFSEIFPDPPPLKFWGVKKPTPKCTKKPKKH